jgi:predicted phosphodiesterase
MRYAVLSDVHGNLLALSAALAAAAAADVDAFLCAGDVIGYGAEPNECVDLLRERGVLCIAGNHELMALGVLASDRCTPLARSSTRWTSQVLRDDVRTFLSQLPLQRQLPGMLVAHGSPDDAEEYVRRPQRAQELLTALPAGVDRLVLGHTHQSWVVSEQRGTLLHQVVGDIHPLAGERLLVNPGSVGQPRSGPLTARFAILDDTTGLVSLREVGYDTAAAQQRLLAAGLPSHSYHPRTGVGPRLAAHARRALSWRDPA